MWRPALRSALGVLLSVQGVQAHHAIGGVYDRDRPATVTGVVAEFRFTAPHPFLFIDVEAEDGSSTRWLLEMDNRWELERLGVTDQTWQPGDRVAASGSLARREPHRLYLLRLDRAADGLRYEQIGSRPRLTPAQP